MAKLEQRLHLVPRYRQKLAFPPLVQGRPVWIDDPHFNARYHVRHTALPAPAGEEELRSLAGRIFAQALDRSKPLWEIWLVDRVGEDAFALISKTHHALVDGVSGVDISTVLFDLEPDPPEPDPAPPWYPRPEPSPAVLLAHVGGGARLGAAGRRPRRAEAARHPERAVAGGGKAVTGLAAMAAAGLAGAPPSPLNVRIGSHRRFAWVDADLERFKAIKSALGGTVNDVVLAAVTGALRAFVIRRGRDVEGMELKAMVPVSVRADTERGALGNRVAAMYAPLPIYAEDAKRALRHHPRGDGRAEGVRAGGRRRGADTAGRVRRADGARPGVAAADAPALLQPRRDERARAAVPALPAGPPAARLLPAGPADAQHRARDRDHVLRRPARLRAAGRLRRDARPRARSPPTSSARSTSSRRPRGSRSRRAPSGAPPGRTPESRHDVVRRLVALLLGTVLVAGGVFALLLAFNARDDAGVGGSAAPAGPGSCSPTSARGTSGPASTSR